MKNRVQFILFVAIIGSISGCGKKPANIVYDKKYIEEIKLVRNEASFYMARNLIPGGTFAIAKGGKLIYSEAMGTASRDLDVKMERKHRTRIADLSQLMTSVMYFKLVENGTLSPDSSVQHYIPDYPTRYFELKLKHLANHISGLRMPDNHERNLADVNVTLEKGLDRFKNDQLVAQPGLYQDFNMFNYNLLGVIMERATGKKYKQLLKEYLTDTLKLSNTVIDSPFITIKGRSDFYDHSLIAQGINALSRDLRYVAPSKGLLSTAEDLAKFGMAVLHSDYINEAMKENMFKRDTLEGDFPAETANSWLLLRDLDGNIAYGRSGYVPGGGAAILVHPELDLVIAATFNITCDSDDIPIYKMASFFDPQLKENKPEVVEEEDN